MFSFRRLQLESRVSIGGRIRELSEFILSRPLFAREISSDPMIFVCGLSRSGTTLLATIFDAHSKVAMGYELIPGVLPNATTSLMLMRKARDTGALSERECSRVLKKWGYKELALFVSRCHRAGLDFDGINEVFAWARKEQRGRISTVYDRLRVAHKAAYEMKCRQNAEYYGFKLNTGSVRYAHKLFPGSYLVYIVRDPRDVIASHIERKFLRTVEEISRSWVRALATFEAFRTTHRGRGAIVRYEDLVHSPRESIESFFAILPLGFEDGLLDYQSSKASVLQTHHPNLEGLKKGFSAARIGRWQGELDPKAVTGIESICSEWMCRFHYPV